jgi:hypothetical protein
MGGSRNARRKQTSGYAEKIRNQGMLITIYAVRRELKFKGKWQWNFKSVV